MTKNGTIWILMIAITSMMGFKCDKTQVESPLVNPAPPAPPATANSFLALGDSYTIGQGVSAAERFPSQTRDWLQQNGISMSDPQVIATTGWTTNDLSSAIQSRNPKGPFSVVTLLIGVNDQYQRHDTIGYRDRFSALLQTAIILSGDRRNNVFVVSIPDYSVTPFAMYYDTASIRIQLDRFNEINQQVTREFRCNYLDITPSTREAKNDATLLAADGLHPSGKEYHKWAERLGPMIKKIL